LTDRRGLRSPPKWNRQSRVLVANISLRPRV